MTHVLTGAQEANSAAPSQPIIRDITYNDLREALRLGWDDFTAMPSHAIFLCIIYPVVGIVLAQFILGYAIVPFLYPLAAGFALLGPIAALGLYELSRRREAGLEASAADALDVLHSPSIGAIAALGVLMLLIFGVWIAVANAIYVANFGYAMPTSLSQFVHDLFTTQAGWTLIILGNLAGFLFAALVLVIGAVSFPLLLDCEVGAAVALSHLGEAVRAQPGDDGAVGPDRRGVAAGRLATAVHRACRGDAGARPRHLASLSQGNRHQRLPARAIPRCDASAPLRGRLPGLAVQVRREEFL